MKKRTFLRLTSMAAMGSALLPVISCEQKKQREMDNLKNWAGNLTYHTTNVHKPKNIEEVQALMKKLSKFRTLGTRHCFNTIADSEDNLILSSEFNQIISIDESSRKITVGAGMRYGEFCEAIHQKGFAIHNLASLPHISVGGAISTATHGSGVGNGNLATAVSAIEFVTPSGEVVNLSREKEGDDFLGAVVGLGCMGFMTKVTLDLIPTFMVKQHVYLDLPMSQLENNIQTILSAAYSVSLFYDWQTENINQVWVKHVEQDGFNPEKDFFGAKPATRNVHPILALSAENCTEQMGVPGAWYERLPHFKMGFTPSSGEELQAEYFVPIEKAVDAIKAVYALRSEIGPLLFITEIRTIKSDEFWLSPNYKQDCLAIHFTLKQNVDGVMALLPKIEAALEPFAPRPHWGKLFTIPKETLKSRYAKMDDFKQLMARFDPETKLVNDFIQEKIS